MGSTETRPGAPARRRAPDAREPPGLERSRLRRIAAYLRPYRGQAALVGLALLGSALLHLLPPLLVKEVVDRAIPARDLPRLLWLCAGMVVGPLLAGLLDVGHKYLAARIGERVVFDLRVELVRHLHRQPLGYFAAARPGEALSRVLNDVQGVGQAVQSTLVGVIDNGLVLATTAALLLSLDWRLGLVALAFVPLVALPGRRVGLRRKGLKRRTQQRMAELVGLLAETLSVSGALLLKVFGAERLEAARLEARARDLMALSLQQTLVGRWFQLGLKTFEATGPALLFAAGGALAIAHQAPLGTLVAAATLLRRLYAPATALAGVQVDLVTSYACVDRVFQLLDLEPAIRDAPGARPLERVRGALSFRGVSFSHGPADQTLAGIDLEVGPGQRVALVGPSGAGKSTLAALVARLYDPTDGAVLVDGIDLRALTLESLRRHLAIVTQETFLFHGSILDNLRYGRPDAPAGEVVAAARAAQIHDLLAALPEGYDTLVGQRGYRLSGGERQRVAIARAILRDPRILILDEATASLDSHNEALIQAALAPLLRGRTCLIIAHRLSTIRGADLIAVLDRGRIAERGTHDELVRRGGLYARLHAEQAGS